MKKNNGKDRQNWFLENDLYGENQRQQRTGGMGNELEGDLEHEEINQDGSIGKEYKEYVNKQTGMLIKSTEVFGLSDTCLEKVSKS